MPRAATVAPDSVTSQPCLSAPRARPCSPRPRYSNQSRTIRPSCASAAKTETKDSALNQTVRRPKSCGVIDRDASTNTNAIMPAAVTFRATVASGSTAAARRGPSSRAKKGGRAWVSSAVKAMGPLRAKRPAPRASPDKPTSLPNPCPDLRKRLLPVSQPFPGSLASVENTSPGSCARRTRAAGGGMTAHSQSVDRMESSAVPPQTAVAAGLPIAFGDCAGFLHPGTRRRGVLMAASVGYEAHCLSKPGARSPGPARRAGFRSCASTIPAPSTARAITRPPISSSAGRLPSPRRRGP